MSDPISFACPACESMLTAEPALIGQKLTCPECGNVSIVPSPTNEFSDMITSHFSDVRNKVFWLALAVILLTTGVPAALTRVFGQPTAGFEDVFTIWNIAWLTFPLTLGLAISSTLLFAADDKLRETNTFWYWIAGIVIASALIGSAMGKFKLSSASRGAIETTNNVFDSSSPARGIIVTQGRKLKGNQFKVIALIGAVLFLVFNYFTLYGPAAFFSSVLIGVFVGWLCGVKLPEFWSELEALEGG